MQVCQDKLDIFYHNMNQQYQYLTTVIVILLNTRNPAIAEGPRDAGVPVEIW